MSSRVAVAMSGGVDSSVAALLLQREGREGFGLTMLLTDCDGKTGPRPSCCGRAAVRDAQKVAFRLGIPHYTVDFRREMEDEVIRDFCDEYARGRTPNPCIRCNEVLKFHLLVNRAVQLGASHLATGHYARLEQTTQGFILKKGRDSAKDQSYFLYRMSQEQAARLLFPLGEYSKDEVRGMAREADLPVADKEESQEVCFVPGDDYAAFLETRRPGVMRPGQVVDTEGRELGRHDGTARFTVGQRKGLGIALGERWYVVRLDAEEDRVVLGSYEQVCSDYAELEQAHWISGRAPEPGQAVSVKIRHGHPGADAVVEPAGDRAAVRFREPQFAVTPGQSAVCYDGEAVLGGGIIRRGRMSEEQSKSEAKGQRPEARTGGTAKGCQMEEVDVKAAKEEDV